MRFLKLVTFLVLMISLQSVFGQSSSALKKRKEAITREIEELKRSRSKIDKTKKLSLKQINLLNTHIK